MRSDTVLEYAVFELSPKHLQCELFVSSNGETEKLATGSIQSFVNNLRVLEAQGGQGVQSSVRLEVEDSKDAETWFTKGTLERFVRFVSNPEALERVSTFDSEVSQLEAARKLYSQGNGKTQYGGSDNGGGMADATKKELLRAIDLRLEAAKKDLAMAIANALANGFNSDTVSELQQFANRFGAHRLDEACGKFISLLQRCPDLIKIPETEHKTQQCSESSKRVEEEKVVESLEESTTVRTIQHTRRLSVQDRINLFESKQKENSSSGGKPVAPAKGPELRRLSSDVSSGPTSSEKSVLRRWSIVSDMNIDFASDKKSDSTTESSLATQTDDLAPIDNDKKGLGNDVVDQGASQHKLMSSKTEFEKKNTGPGDLRVTSEFESVKLPLRHHQRSQSAHMEGGSEIIKVEDVKSQGTDEDVASQPHWRSFDIRSKKKEAGPSERQPTSTDSQRTISQPVTSGSEKTEKSSGGRDDCNDKTTKMIPMASAGKAQRTRQSKGYSSVNDELKMKADELEKLFAEHKLRVPADQSGSSGHGKNGETGNSQQESFAVSEASDLQFVDEIPAGGSGDFSKYITTSTRKMVGDDGDGLRRNFSDIGCSDDSKGKFYEKYMRKRDAKLRDEWSLKRAEKETKLKSMQETLEQSRSEMKAKFSSSSDKKNSISSTRNRAEKFRSFNTRSYTKKNQSEEDEDFSEDKKPRGKDKTSNGNSASRSSQVRKLQPCRIAASVTPRAATSAPKPSAKASNVIPVRRRSEKPLMQSVPNFSDLKKENTRPSSLVTKTSTRTQARNNALSRNHNDEKQEKIRRPRSLRKSSSGNIEFNELTTLYSDEMLAPAGVAAEKNQGDDDHVPGFVADVRDLDLSENLKIEELGEIDSEGDVRENTAKEDLEQIEKAEFDDDDDDDDGNTRMSKEYDEVNNARSEDSSLRCTSRNEPDLIGDMPPSLPLKFHTVASLMESPGESPRSWNSNMQHPFGYQHEHSDIEASADSPMGSPASWSSRMRKKWGTAQNPVVVANSSQLQSRKDLTKGFKRLLKFGRKTRATESFMDWASVTTSEGDDDFEERRDLANRSSDDLRKSRMGSLQSHLSEDGFNDSEFNEQASNSFIPSLASYKLKEDQISGSSNKVPRSFFSLSTFRSKGNESKPR